MADRIESFSVVSQGGLNSTDNHIKLAKDYPGHAVRLINYEPSLYGGYRRVDGYAPYDIDYQEVGVGVAEGKILGVAIYDQGANSIIIAARKDIGANSYSFYRFTFGIGWVAYTTPTRLYTDAGRTVNKIRHAQFNFGDGPRIVFVDGINNAIIFDGTDWIELDPEATGGDAENAGGAQCLVAPAVVEIFKSHIFLSGDEDNKSVVAHGSPNNWYDWTSATGAGQIYAQLDVVQIKPFRDNLYVFGKNAINRVKADASAAFVLEPVTTNVGCIARDSVCEIGGDLTFLSPDGVRPVAGTTNIGDVELETISKNVQLLMANLNAEYDLNNLTSVVIRSKQQLRYFLSDDSDSSDLAYGIIGGIRLEENTQWEFMELLGIRASCATSGYVNTREYVIHGDYNGKVYQQETGSSFDGNDIIAIYKTPYYDMDETTNKKTLRKLFIFMRPEGAVNVNMGVNYDWGDGNAPRPSAYTLASLGAPVVYGNEVQYNTGATYGGNDRPVIIQTIEGSGYSVQFSFTSVGQDPSHSIQGMAVEYSLEGKR